jgi:NitT/TauT family transport system substrate-binding protein
LSIVSRPNVLRLASAAMLGGALEGLPFARSASAQALAVVTVGIVSSSSDAPFFIADKMGFFRAAGIDAQFTNFDGAPQMIAPLGTGQLDVGSGSPSAGFYNGVARGVDVRMVANKAYSPPGSGYNPLMMRTALVKSGQYKSPKDLKGMRIAEPAKGGTTAATLAKLLESVNLSYNDVTHVYLSFPDQVAALATGAIDGTLLNEPGATLAERNGTAIRVLSNDTWYPNQDQAEVFFGSTFIKQRPEIGVRFMLAWLRAARFYTEALLNGHLRGKNAPQVIDILTASTPIKSREIYSSMTSQSVNPNGMLNLRTLTEDLAFYKKSGFLDSDVNVSAAVDTRFQQAAVKQLGMYKSRY